MKRLDIMLRDWGLAPSRAKAQELIQEGVVQILKNKNWQTCLDESVLVDPNAPECVRLSENNVLDYVSRGGRKLFHALEHCRIQVSGKTILDVGISTGGFTDCLLQHGAEFIIGVDVGHGQLAEKLKKHPRLLHFEGVNARQLRQFEPIQQILLNTVDFIVMDLSFISVKLVLEEVLQFLKPEGYFLILIKPQFEVSAVEHNKKGVVSNLRLHQSLEQDMIEFVKALGCEALEYFPAQITGQDGNQEYFLYGKKR